MTPAKPRTPIPKTDYVVRINDDFLFGFSKQHGILVTSNLNEAYRESERMNIEQTAERVRRAGYECSINTINFYTEELK